MIKPLIHRCVVREGSAAGNKVETVVTSYNMDETCRHCDRQLATIDDLTKHMYEELTF